MKRSALSAILAAGCPARARHPGALAGLRQRRAAPVPGRARDARRLRARRGADPGRRVRAAARGRGQQDRAHRPRGRAARVRRATQGHRRRHPRRRADRLRRRQGRAAEGRAAGGPGGRVDHGAARSAPFRRRPDERRHRADRRLHRSAGGLQRPRRRKHLEDLPVRDDLQLPRAAGRPAQRHPAAEGGADEPADGRRRLRRAGDVLPVRVVRLDRLRRARLRQRGHPAAAARDRLRVEHGLRGVPALPDPRALSRDGRQPPVRRRRAAELAPRSSPARR